MHKRRITITCDDYGIHESINRATLKAYRTGVLDSVSLVANGEAFSHAIALLKNMPDVSVGIHFNIVEGVPLAEPDQVRTLLGEDGRFYNSYKLLFKRWILGRVKLEHIAYELSCQIKKIHDQNIEIDYFDSHRHVHLFPGFSRAIRDIILKENIKTIRLIRQPWREIGVRMFPLMCEGIFFLASLIYGRNRRRADYFLGLNQSGRLNHKIFRSWIDKLYRHSTYEIALHIGDDNESLERDLNWKSIGYCFDWEGELDLITSNEIKA